MAVSRKTFRICENYFVSDKKIAELGSQFVVGEEWGSYGPPYFKDVFKHLDITSFDYNGENGAIKVDLSIPIGEEYKNQYDIVTNFGTTEHVSNQHTCWKNIFDMLKPDGLVISEIPRKNNWPNHCKYYYDEVSFNSLSDDFIIMEISNIFYDGQGDLIYTVLRKKHDGEFKTTTYNLMNSVQVDQYFVDPQGH
jgi:hypothetical protein